MPPATRRIAERCRDDGEFRLAARFWNGELTIGLGDTRLEFAIEDGTISPANGAARAGAGVSISAPAEVWEKILAPIPPPFFNDIMPARALGLAVGGDEEMFWQYYPAIRRLVDILREERD